jgi:uncharacterized protein
LSATPDRASAALGWTMDDFALASGLQAAGQSQALCDNTIEAMIRTMGHPSGSIHEATTACESVPVDVTGPAIETLIADNACSRKAVIPVGMSRGNDEDVTTFGAGATFVTSADVPEEVACQTVRRGLRDHRPGPRAASGLRQPGSEADGQ